MVWSLPEGKTQTDFCKWCSVHSLEVATVVIAMAGTVRVKNCNF